MCYSAQIWADYQKYTRVYGGTLDIAAFVELFWSRLDDPKIKIPKAMEQAFAEPTNAMERDIADAIDQFRARQTTELEQELFKQRQRLADAERALQIKPTKTATESRRIAGNKVDWCLAKLADLKRTVLTPSDSRIYPGYYAPVLVLEDGQRVIKPMRYQCRPAGRPAAYDTKYPGTYNARRDNLEGFWKAQFGRTQGLMVVEAFYEHVSVDGGAGPKNTILEFRPNTGGPMLVACLWSHWSGEGQADLLSFAAITDEPPPEVAAAGHDRCIVPIKAEHIDAWLNPNPKDLRALYEILDDRERPYYEHRLAA